MSAKLPVRNEDRASRKLTPAETRIRAWVLKNHGVLSDVARKLDVSVTFVQKVAYNLSEARSKGLRIERELAARGCPLIQKF